jgi:uncharacterized protein YjeT (DUF2065 family)
MRLRWHQSLILGSSPVVSSEFNHLEDLVDLSSFAETLPTSGIFARVWNAFDTLLWFCLKVSFVGFFAVTCPPIAIVLVAGYYLYKRNQFSDPTATLLHIVDGAQAVDEHENDLSDSEESDESGKAPHGRRRPKAPLVARFVLEGKLRFGTPKFNAANFQAVRRFISGLISKPDNDVRRSDQALILEAVTAAIFVPSGIELATAVALDNVQVRQRQAAYADTRLGSLTV